MDEEPAIGEEREPCCQKGSVLLPEGDSSAAKEERVSCRLGE